MVADFAEMLPCNFRSGEVLLLHDQIQLCSCSFFHNFVESYFTLIGVIDDKLGI